jgi:glycosyltransferase involved in cell wall biosynthesis
MPVYNTAEYLSKAIDSVLSQSFGDFELILSDNHSTDGGTDILLRYAEQDKRVKYRQPSKFCRASENRDFGLRLATGEFITYVDSDDSLKPGMYERLFAEQKKYDADISVCNYDLAYSDRAEPSYSAMRDEVLDMRELGYENWFKRYFCMQCPNNYLWTRIIRRQLIAIHGIHFHPVDITEDTIFTMLCSAFAKRIVHISDSYYNYFQREDSTVRQTVRSKNIAESYVYAFNTVADYVNDKGLGDTFRNILPTYAATRVRSVLFYVRQIGGSDEEAYVKLAKAAKGSRIITELRRAASAEFVADDALREPACKVLSYIEGKA